MDSKEYDLIVLGAGAAGENVADRARQGGLTTLLIEHALVGGECSYWACMPSKALLRSAAVIRRITAPKQVLVDLPGEGEIQLSARHAVAVATGSDAFIPDIDGLRAAQPWTSRDATSARSIPASLAIIGGGVIAVEMATAYAGFGASVTVISRGALLEGMEPFAGEKVLESLAELGVAIHLATESTRVSRDQQGFTVETNTGETITAEKLLVATGRSPRTRDIGLDAIGLTPGDWISTDDTLLVKGFDWLYAVGDVNHRALLTHQGKYQARAAGDAIVARANGASLSDRPWGTHVASADHQAVPQVTFTDPEVASVGLTASAARDAGYRVRAVDYEIGDVAGASVHSDEYAGRARMVVDEDRNVILGATFVGQDVSEVLHAATIAIVAEVPLDRLWHAVPAYPTISEIWLRLLETYGRPGNGHGSSMEAEPAYSFASGG